MIARYEQATGLHSVERVVVDREGMAAEFLATLASEGRIVVTVLRTDQYAGLASFREVGEFVPLRVDRHGKVTREVALARFSIPLSEHPGQELDLCVALIRDLCHQVLCEEQPEGEDGSRRWDEKPDGTYEHWLDASWQATPLPAPATVPKLIPMVTIAAEADTIELAHTYTRRWPAQENAIRDWLIPLGIDVNHGYGKTPVINSEVTKKREALQRRLDNVRRWADGAAFAHAPCEYALQETLSARPLSEQRSGTVSSMTIRWNWSGKTWTTIFCAKPSRRKRRWSMLKLRNISSDSGKPTTPAIASLPACEKYCRDQRELLRAIEDLVQEERVRYELDNGKVRLMTVCKVALANLGMWVRDHYFPEEYAHAGWHRLHVFFQLSGRVQWGKTYVEVELKPFNDQALNRDLTVRCANVAKAQPHLPDGRRLLFSVQGGGLPTLDAQERAVA